jgi:hypothetical protein
MPPIVTVPPSGGSTTGRTYTICWANAHAIHPPKNVTHWRVTIGTAEGLNDKYDSGLLAPADLSHACTMPADGRYYCTQVEWTGSIPGISRGNYFTSYP